MGQNPSTAPANIDELMDRVDLMAGLTLGQLAEKHQQAVPKNLLRHKGWAGQLIEKELGATAGSKPEQDFLHLGVELKTIPINAAGRPLETTYICVAPLTQTQGLTWKNSLFYHKLQQILWVPIEGERHIPIAQRHIGTGLLWQPSIEEETFIRQDWEEIMELISMGKVNSITARHGEVLQLRPKAANSRVLTESIGADGKVQLVNPRGFYLKINFTHNILKKAFR